MIPGQPWLDGFNVGEDMIRQFVAMPLGEGYTAEEQLTGAAEHGGLQIIVYPMKRERYEAKLRAEAEARKNARRITEIDCQLIEEVAFQRRTDFKSAQKPRSMGLAPGGLMRQSVYIDLEGPDAWDQANPSRCFVHILNSEQWQAATGQPAPGTPLTPADYADAGMPWFEYYSDGAALAGAKPLAQLDSVAAMGVKLGQKPLPENEAITPSVVIPLGPGAEVVEEGVQNFV